MTLQQLEYVLAVDQHKHFSKAAEHCNVTQPTLSAMIQKLEDELGAKIFDRSVQPIATTAVGHKIVQQAKEVLHQTLRIRHLVEEERTTISGTFRLAVLPTIAPYLLPRFMSALTADHPSLHLRVTEMKTDDIKRALAQGEIDGALLADLGEMPGLTTHSLFYESFYAYVAASEKASRLDVIKTTDITGERLWLLDEGHCFRDQLVRFCQMEQVRLHQMAYQLGSMETFMRMVESGRGITFIPALAVEQLSEDQRTLVRPFAIPRPTRHIVLVTRTDYLRLHIVDLFVQRIRQSVPTNMLTLQKAQTLV